VAPHAVEHTHHGGSHTPILHKVSRQHQGSSAQDGQSGLTTMHKYNELHNKP